jgi:predicted PurR-regulated permease PerM
VDSEGAGCNKSPIRPAGFFLFLRDGLGLIKRELGMFEKTKQKLRTEVADSMNAVIQNANRITTALYAVCAFLLIVALALVTRAS